MRIGIGTSTRFHMLDLAREMKRLGEEVDVYTALPSSRVDAELRDSTRTRPSRMLTWRVAGRLPLLKDLNVWENGMFRDLGRWVGEQVRRTELDVFDALDGVGLEAGPLVRRRGGVWICN